ncbi:bifunctional hydroxymethylpyrimidine kinase/phosphomethylpyrimidine kinase [Chryseobacterium indoltheticum]|uniref:bifunctional hydroxymethylpyrimidine kinase/phosphomethylpyrimidine kinase n=1 Tax=Chryseobacterium indoltheticum TaxID=254 RepID=UPI003F498CEF
MEAVAEQIEAVLDDIFPDAIKIEWFTLLNWSETIVKTLSKYPKIPIVFDPVMVATSGHRLIEEETIQTIVERLFPIAEIITPNMDEASILAKMEVKTLEDMKIAGEKILKSGCKNILLKGGHQELPTVTSLLFEENGKQSSFETIKLSTKNTHGSGCTLSSAIAAFIARGEDLYHSVELAQQYVFEAIKNGKDVAVGKGNGPLNHFFNPHKIIKNELV